MSSVLYTQIDFIRRGNINLRRHNQPGLCTLHSPLDAVLDYHLLYNVLTFLLTWRQRSAINHISFVGHWGTGKYQFLKKVSGGAGIFSGSMCPNLLSAYAKAKVWVKGTQRLSMLLRRSEKSFLRLHPWLFSQGVPRKKVVGMDCVI